MLELVSAENKDIFWKFLQFYMYEHAQFTNDVANETGDFPYKVFDKYWEETELRFPYWYKENGTVMGISFVRKTDEGKWEIAEFGVMQYVRNQGYARKMLVEIFKKHTGEWQLNNVRKNQNAELFWDKLVAEYDSSFTVAYPIKGGFERKERYFTIEGNN